MTLQEDRRSLEWFIGAIAVGSTGGFEPIEGDYEGLRIARLDGTRWNVEYASPSKPPLLRTFDKKPEVRFEGTGFSILDPEKEDPAEPVIRFNAETRWTVVASLEGMDGLLNAPEKAAVEEEQ